MGDVQVDVYSGANLVFSELVATGGALYFDVLTNGVVGDRVRLTANNPGSGLFHLAEVMVFVPEPSRAILLAFGLVAAALRRRR
ncbi:MAG: PEP-CTERM sorting domain-containing protein [Verrucomicrobiales bacterium]